MQAQAPEGLREEGDDSAPQPLHMDAQAGVPVQEALTPGRAEGTGRAGLSGPSLGGPPTTALHPDALHCLFLREPPGERRLCFRELTFRSNDIVSVQLSQGVSQPKKRALRPRLQTEVKALLFRHFTVRAETQAVQTHSTSRAGASHGPLRFRERAERFRE